MAKIKVGVFGAQRGKVMIEVLASHPNAEVVAVCDRYVPALNAVKEIAEKYNAKIALYTDFEKFFLHDMDAVVLANYANEHAPYAIRCLKSGRHVLSEVLPCETMAQAVELIEAVEQSGKVYAYAENYCYMASTFEMWRRYENGDIGEVQYAEGEYVHDCSSIWPRITQGDKNHWRNRAYSTFYCTHSIGPMMMITGRRPVQVVGFETNKNMSRGDTCSLNGGTGGIEMITFDNGAIGKSVHGALKREPVSYTFEVYGTKGMMESGRWDTADLSCYIEGEKLCKGELEHYKPEKFITPALAEKFASHGGSDFYPTHFFIEKILGNPEGEQYSIDVYHAVDMGICGILAYRSILNGNQPMRVPNLRNPEERDAWRNDHACTNPAIAGDQLLPVCRDGDPVVPDEVYARCRALFEAGKEAE